MPRDKCRPHIVAAILDQVLELQFALLVEFVLHLGCAAGVSLRTDTQVLTWRRQRHRVPFFYTHHCHRTRFFKGCAESLIKTLLWFWDSHHWSYQRGTDCNKWGRIIFVGNLLSCETECNFDTAVHTPHAGFSLYNRPKHSSNANWGCVNQSYLQQMESSVHPETIFQFLAMKYKSKSSGSTKGQGAAGVCISKVKVQSTKKINQIFASYLIQLVHCKHSGKNVQAFRLYLLQCATVLQFHGLVLLT